MKSANRKSANKSKSSAVLEVGKREQCTCGSGRRYKACHGRITSAALSTRPFEGFASECDIVAMRELVPAATAQLILRADPKRIITLCTVLPMALPAMVRQNGDILLGLQTSTSGTNASRDIGIALSRALLAAPGEQIPVFREDEGKFLQELVETTEDLKIAVHQDFDFWMQDAETDENIRQSLDRAKEQLHPTKKLDSVPSAYWTNMGGREYLRWLMNVPENGLLNALARLKVAGKTEFIAGARLIGMFRALGCICPVWEFLPETKFEEIDQAAPKFLAELKLEIANRSDLTAAERSARSGLMTRQITLR